MNIVAISRSARDGVIIIKKKCDKQLVLKVVLSGFPSNPEVRKKWVQALITLNGKENTLNLLKTAMICAKHFEKSCFEKIGLSCVRLKPHSIPTIFPRAENKSVKMQSSDNCYEDIKQEQSLQMMDVSNIPNEVPVQTVNVQHDIITMPSSKILSTPEKKKI
ncbi:THAP domain-containing protein 2-like [Polyergus mexicanus]|uniref:THAP domain-containing protein 2-like n=1 Tax=Polyergus mexicanus TaxID=615972 RepID=UPI0038B6B180